ncbi:hypothetical protein SGCOL_001714 [Colletotrichum sp. CLE4]
MRKKEKEQAEKQAEKEAKSVKKKLAAKLSKAGPNTKASPPRPPNASRSISSPTVFVNEHLRSASAQAFYEPPPPIRPQHARQRSDSVAMQLKAALTGHKTQNQSHHSDDQGFIGGLKLEQKRQVDAGIPFRKPNPPAFLTGQRSHSFGPEVRVTPPAMTPSALPRSFSFDPQGERPDEYDEGLDEPKTPRSASINTPTWSQPLVSPTAPPVPDVSNFQQWINDTKQSQVPADDDELEIHNGLSEVVVEQERVRRRESYVHQSRQQSRERSINGYREEVRVSSAKSHYPPASNRPLQSRVHSSSSDSSSMGSNFPPRNGSLSSLGGYKDQPTPGEDFTLTFRLPYTPPAGSPGQPSFDRSTSQGPPMSRMMSREIPLPPERAASREGHPPTPGAAIRSFKDAAKAAFQRVSPSGSSKPPVSNYFTRAARDTTMTPDSTSSSRYSTDEPSPFTAPPRPFAESTESASRDSSARPTHRSSMSSCDESLPSPSPATTPDSSRPQSEKGLPPLDGELGRVDNETVVVTNDTRSYRLSHKAAMQTASPIATNQRISLPPQIPVQNHEAHLNELEALVTEKFGRKASVADAEDSDSSLSYPTPTHTDSSKTSAMATPLTSASLTSPYDYGNNGPVQEASNNIGTVQEEVLNVVQRRPSLTKSRSSPDLALDTSFLPKLKHQPLVPRSLVPPPPPRSSKRGSVANLHAKAASQSSFPVDVASRKAIVSTKAPSNPSSYLEEARKSMPPPRSSRVSRASIVPPSGVPEPVAKMLVECCSCKFLHDMPSMAKPDSMVEDRKLGVSGLISTTVKCPWCAHGMTTNCCAGYAAVIYLKEKLH